MHSEFQDLDQGSQRNLRPAHDPRRHGSPAAVIAAVDSFAWSGQWMMNVGDRKGALLDAEVRKVVAAGGTMFLEIGTYCGYSATRIASHLGPGSRLYSLEYNPGNAAVARQVLAHAGLEATVQVLNGTADACSHILKDRGVTTFDLIFLDQWKEQYIPDLKVLMEEGFLHRGTVIVADNLIYPGNPEYIKWMESDPDFEFTLHKTLLEYSETVEDAVGVSVFVGTTQRLAQQ
ncbi:MAG: hypothetical protein WDW38_009531 [Sanguina aurantia]